MRVVLFKTLVKSSERLDTAIPEEVRKIALGVPGRADITLVADEEGFGIERLEDGRRLMTVRWADLPPSSSPEEEEEEETPTLGNCHVCEAETPWACMDCGARVCVAHQGVHVMLCSGEVNVPPKTLVRVDIETPQGEA